MLKQPKIVSIWCALIALLMTAGSLNGIESGDLIRLQEAGIDADTIGLIIDEKTLETCAMTAAEIVALKEAGFSNAAIRTVVSAGSFMKGSGPVVYGKNLRPVRLATVEDLVALKSAGLSEETIRAVVIGLSPGVEASDRLKAWEMLTEMGILIDRRK